MSVLAGRAEEEELRYRGLLEALNAKSVREGWAWTIGLQQRTQQDKAVFVTTGIHFCQKGQCARHLCHTLQFFIVQFRP